MKKRLLAGFVTVAMLLTLFPARALAAELEDTGPFTVTGGTLGTDYSYADNTLTILSSVPLTITGTTTEGRIVVDSGVDADITLSNINIDLTEYYNDTYDSYYALGLQNSGSPTIKLEGKNVLKGGYRSPGIWTSKTGATTIDGPGELEAAGGDDHAGIGGCYDSDVGDIIINGGTITATGGDSSAGIGSGNKGQVGNITINSGTITATGGSFSAGIGGGSESSVGNITINGGTVKAVCGYGSAGIGSGNGGTGGTITIIDGDVSVEGGSAFDGGAGGGIKGSGITIKGGTVRTTDSIIGEEITISGGTVTATGGAGNLGISGSNITISNGTVTANRGMSGNKIDISGGTVTATGDDDRAGISGSEITISRGEVIATGHSFSAGIQSSGGNITITGGKVTATGGYYGAGIGGGYGEAGGTITISGGTVTATGGNTDALYGSGGAGIGGGGAGYDKNTGYAPGGAGGTITITGGTIIAKGGYNGPDNAYGGAGIGGGGNGAGGNITISGGKVTATGGVDGAGIGAGWNQTDGSFSTGPNGNAVIVTPTISDTSGSDHWNGIIFQDTQGTVYGNVTLSSSLDIPKDTTLAIGENMSLTIPNGVTLTNGGTITDNGAIINNGTLTNNGTIEGSGSISGSGTFHNNGICTITIKVTPTVTVNPVDGLVYTGSGQELVTGSTTGGTLQYSLSENDGYSTKIPEGTDAGKYTVYYKVVGDNNYNDVAAKSVNVEIAKKQEEKPTASIDDTGKMLTGLENGAKYSISDGGQGMEYTASDSGTIAIEAGWFGKTISIVKVGRDNNHSDSDPQSISIDVPALTTHTVTVQNESGGTASASPSTATEGTQITLTANADNGYHFKEWQVISGGITITDGKFTMPAVNVTVKAIFEKDVPPQPTTYNITVQTDGNGQASASPSTAAEGTQITLTTTANSGYHFKEWQVVSGGVTITGSKFTMPAGDVTVKAIFEKNDPPTPPRPTTYAITVQTEGSGTASASRTTATRGTTVTLTATADDGWHFKEWQVISGGVTITDGKFTMPARDVTVKAVFEKDPPPPPAAYDITVQTEGNGEASASASNAAEGTQITLTATPDAGWHFKEWQVVSGSVTITDSKFAMSAGDVTVKAVFEKDVPPPPATYAITVQTEGSGTASASASIAAEGAQITLTAMPDTGWHFKEWQVVSGDVVITDSAFTMPAGAVTVKAIFEKDPPPPTIYLVTFDSQGGSEVSSQRIQAGEKVIRPADPVRRGYNFGGWYKERYCATAWNFNTDTVAGDTTLYARWTARPTGDGSGNSGSDSNVGSGGGTYTPPAYPPKVEKPSEGGSVTVTPSRPHTGDKVTIRPKPDAGYEVDQVIVTDKNGNPVAVTENLNGTYTFIQPNSSVKIDVSYQPTEVTPAEKPWSNPFADISASAWPYDAVRFVTENGLMNGYSNGTFGPNDNLTRAQLAQILYNKEGKPSADYILPFGDIFNAGWYAGAVRWAAAQGIVSGYGNGLFGPDDNITREQLAVMLWRYAGSPAATSKELHFADASTASGYALDALRWAVENGILNGSGDGLLNPGGLATRAQAAQMLKSFMEM